MVNGSTRTRRGFCARPTSRRACVVALLLTGLVHAGTARGEDWVLAMPANTLGFLEEDDVLALFNYVGTPTTTRILPLLQLDAARAMLLLFPFAGAQPLRGRPYSAFLFNLLAFSYAPNAG